MSNSGNRRIKRQGQTVPVFELHCGRCHRSKLLTKGEMGQLAVGLVPYCADCLRAGNRVQMAVRRYTSGPDQLNV